MLIGNANGLHIFIRDGFIHFLYFIHDLLCVFINPEMYFFLLCLKYAINLFLCLYANIHHSWIFFYNLNKLTFFLKWRSLIA